MNHQLKQFKNKFILFGIVSTFSACGIIPVTETPSLNDDIFFKENIVIETQAATKTDAEIVEVNEKILEEDYTPRPTFRNARGYWLAALEYLQVGEEEDAEWALHQALKLQPDSKISKTLLHQIESDAINLLGENYFEYKIQRGDSLSKLAKIHLNDPLKFYILAKYNQISNPSRLIIGRSINIPGEKSEPVNNLKVSKPVSAAMEKSVFAIEVQRNKIEKKQGRVTLLYQANELFLSQEYVALINLLIESEKVGNLDKALVKLLVETYYFRAKELLLQGDTATSKSLLLNAAEREPDNVQVNMALIDLDETGEVQQLVLQSRRAQAANSPLEAYELINRALQIQPDFIAAIESKEEIKKDLSMYYYKNALMAQRRQQLDKAIKYWDEVLVLDEGNQNAKLYRAKSLALQAKMKEFVSAL